MHGSQLSVLKLADLEHSLHVCHLVFLAAMMGGGIATHTRGLKVLVVAFKRPSSHHARRHRDWGLYGWLAQDSLLLLREP